MYDTDRINEYDDWISKSQKKRDSKKLNNFAEKIVDLRDAEFQRLDFSELDFLEEELLIAKKIKKNCQFEPFRRQMLHIERLLRSCDEESIANLNKQLDFTISKNTANNAKFHRLEQLRNYLVTSDDYMTIVNKLAYSNEKIDKNKLRNLISKTKLSAQNMQTNFSTELFRYLRDNIENDQIIKDLLNEKNII